MATINDRAANQRRYTDEPPRRNDRVTFLAAIGAAFVATVGFGVALTETFVGRLVPWIAIIRAALATCGMNAWAKPLVSLVCGVCHEPLKADGAE